MKARLLALAAVGTLAAALLVPAGAVAASPTIGAQWVTDVTHDDATLHAEINPNGLLTKYKLQLDTTGNFKFDQNDSCPLHPPGIGCAQVLVPGDPLPPGLVPPIEQTLLASTESQHVSVNMASIGAILKPGTTYHYRTIVANGHGFTFGPTQTFTTPLSTGPPTIGAQWVTDVTQDDATLHAMIDPHGLTTYYELQIDTTGNFKFAQNSSCPLDDAPLFCLYVVLPGDPLPPGLVQPPEFVLLPGGDQHVSVNMASIGAILKPGTTYHYRTIVANGPELIEGDSQTFTTPTVDETLEKEDESVDRLPEGWGKEEPAMLDPDQGNSSPLPGAVDQPPVLETSALSGKPRRKVAGKSRSCRRKSRRRDGTLIVGTQGPRSRRGCVRIVAPGTTSR